MLVFLDFEASSLGDRSYPIEVGWVFADGTSETHLIRPAPDWTDWDPGAEAIHRIPREELLANGTPHDTVAQRMVETLSEHDLRASAPSWDGKWLSALLRAAGLPRHTLRLRDSDAALEETAREILAAAASPETLDRAIADVLASARQAASNSPPAHRALADAEQERRRWLAVQAAAHEVAGSLKS